jgi:hypothetical protein
MLDPVFVIVAIALRILAGADYLIATVRSRVKPNPVTWLFWGLAPLIAFAAQLQNGLTPASWVTLALGVGPLLIFGITITKNRRQRWKIGVFDILCGASAALGLALWQATSDPALALTFGILADILGGLPTVYKAYIKPETEKSLPYFLSVLSMIVTLLTLTDWSYLQAGFPLYILCINVVIATLVWTRIGVRMSKKRN